jgi:CheY-like chemotaxis protein
MLNRRVAVVADDLIWRSRLVAAVERSGATPLTAASRDELDALLSAPEAVSGVLVDLNGRVFDGIEAVRAAASAGRRVLAVGQHEDLDLRRRALAAGAVRVFSYNKLFADGPRVVGALLDGSL